MNRLPKTTPENRPPPPATPLWARWALVLLPLVSSTLSALLVAHHVFGAALPGCGFDGGCGRAAASAWGTIPGVRWSTAWLGLSFGVSMLAVLPRRDRPSPAIATAACLAAVASIGLVIVMVLGAYFCWLCLGVHTCHVVLAAIVLCVVRRAPMISSARGLGTAALTFALTLLLGGTAQSITERSRAGRERERLRDSVGRIVEGVRPTDTPRGLDSPATPGVAFEGRYRIGPDPAPVRVVVFTDYQCADCQRVEGEIEAARALAPQDVAVSFKHFPFCAECNPHMPRTIHPNACWAARAAEAAGQVAGVEGFRLMHGWLFARRGAFTRDELVQGMASLGLDSAPIIERMQSVATLTPVQTDVEQGMELGLHYTPMVFVNGVELRGWRTPGTVRDALTRVINEHLPPRTATQDRPPGAIDKAIADWRAQTRLPRLDDARWFEGAGDAPVRVVAFADWTAQPFLEFDTEMRRLLAEGEPIRYEIRLFPGDRSCNPVVKTRDEPHACRSAELAAAAGIAGGGAGFARAATALPAMLEGLDSITDERAADQFGVPVDEFVRALQSGEAREIVRHDVQLGQSIGATTIPAVYINARAVPRWKLVSGPVLGPLVRAAAVDVKEDAP